MRRVLLTVLIVGVLTGQALGAASLLDYEKRVFRSAEQVERVKVDSDYAEEGISYVKSLLPRSEDVEMQGQVVKVDNAWLHDLLDSYRVEGDELRRVDLLDDAEGRLRLLDSRLREAQDGSLRQTDGARSQIKEILSRPAYKEKAQDPVTVYIRELRHRVFKYLGELYARVFSFIFGSDGQGNWVSQLIISVLLLAGVVVAIRILLRYRRARKGGEKRVILGEEVEADVSAKELADAALAAARVGDFRSGVRNLYISLLYELADRNLIEIEAGATNREYLTKVTRHAPLVGPMRYLTERFEYIWYGMFPSSAEEFSAYLARYKEAVERAEKLGEQSVKA